MGADEGKRRFYGPKQVQTLSGRVLWSFDTTTLLAALPATNREDRMVAIVGTTTPVLYWFDADAVSGDVQPAAGDGYWKALESDAAALAALALTTTGNGASLVGIEDAASLFTAANAEAALAEVMGKANAKVGSYHRLFDHADTDVAVAATTVAIDFGSALPTNAIVLAVLANVTEEWEDDGPTDTWEADVGVSGGDDDKYTPTALTLDTVADLGSQIVCLDGSATQLALTINASGSKQLDELVTGKLDLTVLFVTPEVTEVAAP